VLAAEEEEDASTQRRRVLIRVFAASCMSVKTLFIFAVSDHRGLTGGLLWVAAIVEIYYSYITAILWTQFSLCRKKADDFLVMV